MTHQRQLPDSIIGWSLPDEEQRYKQVVIEPLESPPARGNLERPYGFCVPLEEAFMVDVLSKRGPQARSRINLTEPHEPQYWGDKFGVPTNRLSGAVGKGDTLRMPSGRSYERIHRFID